MTKGGIELIGHEEVAVLKQHHGPMGISMETVMETIEKYIEAIRNH